ncbi:MAG: HesA/MoeB/ThiF family protein [Blastocatellia bacterium]
MEATKIKDPTRDRYHAIALSSVWSLDLLRNSSALVVGAGALGNEVAKNLAMMGIRLIVIADRDRVEVANLTRSVFFRESDHGRLKSEVLSERLVELNPDVTVLPVSGDLEETIGLGLIRRVDMIFSCLDNRLARKAINRMCQKVGRAWVDGSMENLLGDAVLYLPDEGPCYECTLTRIDKELMRQSIPCKGIAVKNINLGKVPTISTMGSIIAALQVQEGLKTLHGQLKGSLAGKRLVVNCLMNDIYTTQVERKEDCEGHFRFGAINEVPQWTRAIVTPRDILNRFNEDTGREGHLALGRDVVIGLTCAKCDATEEEVELLHLLSMERAICFKCGEVRDPVKINTIRADDPYADWPLKKLRIPPLEVLEVKSGSSKAWYEITGDLETDLFGLL